MIKISTSILNAEDRVGCVLELNETCTSYIHIDVMDGVFVPNVQFVDIEEIRAINRISKYPMDVHLMVEDPMEYVEKLKGMNIRFVTFHLEVDRDISGIIAKVKELGYRVGISVKPGTDIRELATYLMDIDLVLVMSVEPGLGGQEFLEETVSRVQELRKMVEESCCDVLIEVDGGINDKTISKLEYVDIAVVGSYITKSDDYNKQIHRLLDRV